MPDCSACQPITGDVYAFVHIYSAGVNFPCYAFTGFISLAMSSSRISQQPADVSGLRSPAADLLERLVAQITLAEVPHETIVVRAPYTGAQIGTIPAGTAADLEVAVERARAAQTAWSKRTFSDRADIFLRFHDLLLERQDEVLDLIQWETGKARRHAFEEILDTTIVTRYYARRAERLLRPRRRKGALPCLRRPGKSSRRWVWSVS